jgi:hypothetical protein
MSKQIVLDKSMVKLGLSLDLSRTWPPNFLLVLDKAKT